MNDDSILEGAQSDTTASDSIVNDTDAPESKEVNWEKRYKDTQAAYTRARQEVAALKAQTAALEQQLAKSSLDLDPKVQEELEALKIENPEAWRQKLNAIENARAKEINSEAALAAEKERRTALLEEYNESVPDNLKITSHTINFVLPQGMVNKIKKNEVTFEAFLNEAKEYLSHIKVGQGNSSKAGVKDIMTSVQGKQNSVRNKDTAFENQIF